MTIQEYEITKVNISQLQFDNTNPNKLTKDQETALKRAFKRFGYLVPIVINENYEIGDGEHRAKLYQELGIQEIPAYIVPKINDDIERRLLRQTMNKLRGEHEIKLDADEIALIFQNNKLNDLSELLGNQRDELEQILTKHKGIQFHPEDNFDVDKELEDLVPVTELGDIWQLGKHRIICADCSDERSIKKLMEGQTVDMLLTDPPYGVDKGNFHNEWNEAHGWKTHKPIENDNIIDYDIFFKSFLSIIPFSDYNVFYIFMSGSMLHILRSVLDLCDLTWGDYLIWVKNGPVIGRKDYKSQHEFILYGWCNHHKFYGEYESTVLNFSRDSRSELHPTMKPIPLLSKLIHDGSQENNMIFDPFLGSGSTLISCEQTNRICYGVEIDPRYVDIICKRYLGFTGGIEPVREKDNKTYSELKAGN